MLAAACSLAAGSWLSPQAWAQARTAAPYFRDDVTAARSALGSSLRQSRALTLDAPALQAALATAPAETQLSARPLVLALPLPDGGTARFAVVETAVMAPALAARYPMIKTYRGTGLDDPDATVRLDMTPRGFHAQILSRTSGTIYVDPATLNDPQHYLSFYRRDMSPGTGAAAPGCQFKPSPAELAAARQRAATAGTAQRTLISAGPTLRTYRLAVATTGEYTTFHGGTVALGLSAVVTSVNRVVGVYEKELAVRLQLVAGNDRLIYTNANTDPYDNDDASTLLTQNQANVDAIIGASGYDIGHVFSTDGGGLAGLGVVCRGGNKARGETGTSSPVGDAYDIDYVAHEMGHQFGGNHTFNSPNSSCTDNGNPSTAFEPGSGSTIMAYAGICGNTDNLQGNSDAYFHSGSIQEMLTFIATATCATTTATGNTAPVVSVPSSKTLPIGTPFRLSAGGTDAEGDALTYCWEQMDLGPFASVTAAQVANSNVPLFRSFLPTTSPTRYFPRLANVINNATNNAERLPTVTRTLKFRCTVRDRHSGPAGVIGGVNYSTDVNLGVTSAAGPFLVTAPNTAVTWTGNTTQTVTWNVAGTAANGVNCATVNILLSTDGGFTYPTTLVSGTANDGSASVSVPNVTTSQARIMVAAADNYFFDISNANFTITAPTACNAPTGVAVNNVTQTTATVSFAASASATGYTVTTTPATTTQTVPGTSANLTGLTPGTSYAVNVVSNCTGGATSTAATASFTTTAPPPCNAPTNLAAGSITVSSASISFTASGTASSYTVTTFPATTTQTVTGSPVTLTGLSGATNYTVSIVSNCTSGVTSTPGTLSFATRVANDECATAISLTSGLTCATISGTVTGATQSQAASTCDNSISNSALDVWYSFVATGPQHTIRTNSAFDGVLQVYAGSCGSLTSLDCRDMNSAGGESLTFTNLTSGARYYVRYYPYVTASVPVPADGSFTICVTGPATPTAAPVVLTPANGSLISSARPPITGTAPSGTTVAVYLDGTSSGSTTANASGNWSFTPTTNLADGSHTVYATAAVGANISPNSNTNTFTVDATAPTVAISSTVGASGSSTSTSPIPFTVTFSESVSSFVASDVTVTGGAVTAGSFSGSGTTYNFSVTPAGNGTVTVNVAAGVAQDAPGNGNAAASPFSIIYNQATTAAPVVVLPANGSFVNSSIPTYSGTAPASVVIVYVDGIATAQSVGNTNWSITQPTPLAEGTHTVYATAQIQGQFVSPSSNTNTFIVDTTAPTVSLSSSAGASGSSTTTSPLPFTATFSEPVTGFSVSGIQVTNGSVSSLTTSNATTYTFVVTPITAGTPTTVQVLANAAQDVASNGNAASSSYSLTYLAPVTATTWTGAVSTDWYTAANWTGGVPTASLDATVPGNAPRMPLIAAGVATTRNLTIGSGATLNQTAGTLDVRANLTNNGTFVPSGGTTALGSTAQTNGPNILGSSRIRFWNLTVGTNGLLLSTSAGASARRLVTLNGALVTQGNPFTLESDANNTAMLVNNGSNAVLGNVTVQRYIVPDLNPNLGYRHVSAPTGNATVSNLATAGFTPVVNPAYNTSAQPSAVTPFPTVYGYDQSRLATATNTLSTFDKGWYSPATLSTPLGVGQGYTVNMPAGQTLAFTGPQNNGSIAVALSRNTGPTAADAGLALVGNPYPAPLDWSQLTDADRPGVDAAMYVFVSDDPTNAYAGTYRFFNNGIGTISPVLPLGQGFFVRVTPGQTAGTINFRNSHRVTSYTNPVYHRPTETRPLVQLTLKAAGATTGDDAFVYFEQGATDGFDSQYDAEKLPNPSGLNLSTSLSATQRLSIDGRAALGTAQRVVPLAVGVPAVGSYTLSAAELLNLTAVPVYLRDVQTGALIDLVQQSSYSFTVTNASALITGRFELVFSPQRPLAATSAATALQLSVWPNPVAGHAQLHLTLSKAVPAGTATLRDVLGRTVATHDFSGSSTSLPTQGLATGTYLLSVTAPGQAPVTRRVVVE
ncbi:hypothetical protein B0919_11645 [Hymenobacter sp. CRA2]|nr:hypothetical protein B0919_11645 [Hymenobacter sp. CRA2]